MSSQRIYLILGQVCLNADQCRYIPFNMSNQRLHWAIKHRWTKAWKEEVQWAVFSARRGQKFPFKHAKIKIYFFTVRVMDYDGAYNAAKPLLDGLIEAGVIMDDSPKYIELTVQQKAVASKEEQRVEIFIEAK